MLDNYVLGRWRTPDGDGEVLRDAVTGDDVAVISSDGVDFAEVVGHARTVGQRALRQLTFHTRALLLKELALRLKARREELYELSYRTGATRNDSWADIDGGIGTLLSLSSKARRELPNANHALDGAPEVLSKDATFIAQHVATPLDGVAIHISAFNFPVWGLLEKFGPAFIAGVPVITKPAPQTAYLSHLMVQVMVDTGLLPSGALQFFSGDPGDLLDHVTGQDLVSVTGSAATARRLRTHRAIVANSTRYIAEADSLNAAILGPDVTVGSPEFDLYVKEVAKEMTFKAGQKCTAIRRAFVPAALVEPVAQAIQARLAGAVVGDPRAEGVRMGSLVSLAQRESVLAGVETLSVGATVLTGPHLDAAVGADVTAGAFVAPTLLLSDDARASRAHDVEAFGPVSTLLPYDGVGEVVELVKLGRGSLVASLFTADLDVARDVVRGIANHHGRVLVVDASVGTSSTGHGPVLPNLVHGGPGRAGGSEELGGARAVWHYLQRTAVQGSPDMVTAITGRFMPGATVDTSGPHPFTRYFEDIEVGQGIVTSPRTLTQEDIDAFAALTGDTFYAHTDPVAAAANPFFDGIVAHGYLLVSMAAGEFVDPAPGPVLANTGLEDLRFATPTYPGDEIVVHFTCKDKTDRVNADYGEVRWDVVVRNAKDDVLATYDVLTMVENRVKSHADPA